MANLICTLELDKEKGLTVKVEDPEGKLTQTVTLDGQAITLEVKSASDTSTVVQKADGITIRCKAFTVEADTLTLQSKQASAWTSQQTLQLESTQDMTLTSSAKLTQKATADATLSSGANVQVNATGKLALEGQQMQLAAPSGELAMEAMTLKLSGKAQAEMEAPLIKVAAQGQLGLESSGVAELKGSIASVSGSLVKLG
jgi:phage baseplate assembly protein gpV